MDARALELAELGAQDLDRLRSLLVIRRGRLVLERYYDGASRDDLADVRSVTKSVVATLTGLAVEKRYLTGLDETLGEILPAEVATLDDVERATTVRDLLTMSGGWEWHESGAVGYNEWVLSADHVGYLLDKPHVATPGTTFEYNSASAHLLGVVLAQASGKSLPALADELLFGPLAIGRRSWESIGDNEINGAAGLELRPRDLARLGQLHLQDGWSGDDRILPDGWVSQTTTPAYTWTSPAGPTHVSYGYLWWTDEDNDAFMAWGYGGQFIYVAPGRDLVVVATTRWWQGAPADLATRVLGLIVDDVVPAAPRN
jgi:CubicO group peptidase (beta-lactamase class C family)